MPHSAKPSPLIPAEESEVPVAVQRQTSARGQALGCAIVALFLVIPAVLYFGFFGILLVDEEVLRTNYLDPEKMPDGFVDAVRFVYAPLIYLINQIS